jgi:hypothetical protein
MSSKRTTYLAAVLLCVTLVWPATGCGDSGETQTDQTEAAPAVSNEPAVSMEWIDLGRSPLLTIPPDPYDEPGAKDALVTQLLDDGSPLAIKRFGEILNSEDREEQTAGARGALRLAHEAVDRGEFEAATSFALNVYLSGAPHRVRLNALQVFCVTGPPDRVRYWLMLIETGRQDIFFKPMLPELQQLEAARAG